MIVVDNNIISELTRPQPNIRVVVWIKAHPSDVLYTTYINQIEILYGIAMLPEGRRRKALAIAAESIFAEDFANRILPFDAAAAARYAEIVVSRRKAGNSLEGFDALIAAIALAASADIATRDIDGFSGCGLTLINPWGDL